MQQGKEMIENLIDPCIFNRDFDNVDDMISRLCEVNIFFFPV
jgi:hypothetical protein